MSRRRRLYLAGAVAVLAIGALLLGLHLHRSSADDREREARMRALAMGPRVPVAIATPAPPTRTLTLPGDVRPFREATLYARVSGYLATLEVDRGDRVAKDQVLGRVTTPETDLQLAPLRRSYAQKKAIADRLRPLVPKGVVTQVDLERAEADAQAAKSDVDRLAALRSFDVIRAPFAGTITRRYVDVGALMPAPTGATQAAQPLVDVTDTSRVRIVVYVGQRDATGIRLGDAVSIARDADPRHPTLASVTQLPHELDLRTRTMWVEADVDNRSGAFYPGAYVTVTLDVPAPPGVLIPSAAIGIQRGEPIVALVRDDRIHFQPVEIADDDGKQARVIHGVRAGDALATRVSDELSENGRVQAIAPRPQAGSAAGRQIGST